MRPVHFQVGLFKQAVPSAAAQTKPLECPGFAVSLAAYALEYIFDFSHDFDFDRLPECETHTRRISG